MDNFFMQEAIKEAKTGIDNGDGGPFGSVVVKDGKIIGKGHNKVVAQNDPTAHGEICAIRDACKNIGSFSLKGCELYTTAEPCPMCLAAILWARIDKVYYGCNVDDTAKIGFDDSEFYKVLKGENKLCEVSKLNREDCIELFKEYAKKENNVKY